jgi:hypothetical protein
MAEVTETTAEVTATETTEAPMDSISTMIAAGDFDIASEAESTPEHEAPEPASEEPAAESGDVKDAGEDTLVLSGEDAALVKELLANALGIPAAPIQPDAATEGTTEATETEAPAQQQQQQQTPTFTFQQFQPLSDEMADALVLGDEGRKAFDAIRQQDVAAAASEVWQSFAAVLPAVLTNLIQSELVTDNFLRQHPELKMSRKQLSQAAQSLRFSNPDADLDELEGMLPQVLAKEMRAAQLIAQLTKAKTHDARGGTKPQGAPSTARATAAPASGAANSEPKTTQEMLAAIRNLNPKRRTS